MKQAVTNMKQAKIHLIYGDVKRIAKEAKVVPCTVSNVLNMKGNNKKIEELILTLANKRYYDHQEAKKQIQNV